MGKTLWHSPCRSHPFGTGRHTQLALELHGGCVAIAVLAREFGVSAMTIRRDFAALEEKSHVQRTHGGAVLTERMMLEFDYRERRERNRAAKCAIAAAARSHSSRWAGPWLAIRHPAWRMSPSL